MSRDVEAPGKRGLKADHFAGLMLVALAAYVMWANREYPLGTLAEPGPGYMPLALALFVGAMGMLIAIGAAQSPLLSAVRWTEAKRATLIMTAAVIAVLLLEELGYRISIIALLVFLLGVLERKSPLAVGLVSLGFGFGSYYVVADLLLVPLPRSPWGF